MRSFRFVLAFAALALGCWVGTAAFGGDEAPEAPAPEKSAEPSCAMEEAMMALAAPGEMHAFLAKWAGTWTFKFTGIQPDGSTVDGSAKARISMILGGRFQVQDLEGTLMGQPYNAHGVTGYDNLSKKFQNFWFDSMGTAPSVASGSLSADGKTLELSGTWDMPENVKSPFRFVSTFVDANTMKFDMYAIFPGMPNEMKMMSGTYTRD